MRVFQGPINRHGYLEQPCLTLRIRRTESHILKLAFVQWDIRSTGKKTSRQLHGYNTVCVYVLQCWGQSRRGGVGLESHGTYEVHFLMPLQNDSLHSVVFFLLLFLCYVDYFVVKIKVGE